jgi:GNAT superfamily N-acetyltransferase
VYQQTAMEEVVVRLATVDEIVALRHRELRPGFPESEAHFDHEEEPTTRHLGAFRQDSGEIVGCASFVASPLDGRAAFRLRGMATRADWLRRGIGTRVLRFGESILSTETDATLLWCHARLVAVPFYVRLGWRIVSDVFDIPTVGPHHRMVRTLGAQSTTAGSRSTPTGQ